MLLYICFLCIWAYHNHYVKEKGWKKNNKLFQSVINIVKNQNIGKTQKKNKPITFAAKMVGRKTLAAKCIYTG